MATSTCGPPIGGRCGNPCKCCSRATRRDERRPASGLGRRSTPHGPVRRWLRAFIHFVSYHLVLARRDTRVTRAAGFRLTVRPTVFHPRYFISSERFAEFIGGLDLRGKRVVDVGTGSGILALAAARAGADSVIATDINPNAALPPPTTRAPTASATASPPCAPIFSPRWRPARCST